MQARTVLEGLQTEDLWEGEKPVKGEIRDAKVNEQTPQFSCHQTFTIHFLTTSVSCLSKSLNTTVKKKVKVETGDLLRLCHTVPLEVVNLGRL